MTTARPTESGRSFGRILYVSTREPAYARNQTLVRALARHANVDVVAPTGYGRGADNPIVYAWGFVRVVAKALARALHPVRGRDMLVLGFLAQPLAPLLRPFWRGPVVADAMVSVYDTLCHDKQWADPESTVGRVARWLDSYLVRHTDRLIFDTRQHLEYFRALSGARLPPSCVVPVGARAIGPARQEPSRSGRLQVVFVGSYVPLQGASVIARAAELLRDDPIDFTMIGAGQEYSEVARIVQDKRLVNVHLVGWMSLDRLDDWYRRADVVLGIFGRTAKTQRVIPNKVFEALSIGQPVITSDTPAIRELFVPGKDVICCAADDPASLAGAIRWASTHREEIRDVGRVGRTAFDRHASDDALAAALWPVFGPNEA